MRKRASKSPESTASGSRLAKLRQTLPRVKPGTPEPLLWAASGALFGLGISMAGAALSDTIGRNLQFVALLLSSLLKVFPVAMAGALIGAFVALGWFGVRR
jgi:hypothetical protein